MTLNRVVNSEPKVRTCKLRDLTIGDVAVGESDGKHYMRTCTGATCLNNGDTYTFGCGEWGTCLAPETNNSKGPDFDVRPLRAGVTVTITVGQ